MGSCVSHVSLIVWAKSKDSVHKPQFLKRRERRAKADRTEVLLLTTLAPYHSATPAHIPMSNMTQICQSAAGQAEVHQQGVVDEVCGSQARVATVQTAQLGELTGRKHVTAEEGGAVTSAAVGTVEATHQFIIPLRTLKSAVTHVSGLDTDF